MITKMRVLFSLEGFDYLDIVISQFVVERAA